MRDKPSPRSLATVAVAAYLGLFPNLACGRVAERTSSLEPKTAASNVSVSRSTSLGVSESQAGVDSPASTPSPPPPFFEKLREQAKALTQQGFVAARPTALPKQLAGIDYDAYRSIRFRPEHSLWRDAGGNFEVQFFHPGFSFDQPVKIWLLEHARAAPRELPFSRDWFSYDLVPAPPADSQLAFTGFRLHAPLNQASYRDEVVVFQGASYFRPLGKGSVYGLSARGLAIDMGEPTPEEFPRFTDFYLVRPRAGQKHVWVMALLDSQRASGAFAFRIEPGVITEIEVTADLFLREPLSTLGLAPLTSMYLFGEESERRFGDFRPEVHDSDGVLMAAHGEWLFRPLTNPTQTRVTSFRLDEPQGFGLLQRDRDFESYQDLEAQYQARPSVWIEPIGGFGKGQLRLLEIATRLETDDNIAVAWVPDDTSSRELRIEYRMHVGNELGALHSGGFVAATRLSRESSGTRFLVDFAGKALLDKEPEAIVSVERGRVLERHVEKNPYLPGVRASFLIEPEKGARDVELRAFLRSQGDALTETWSYLWHPKD